MICLLLILALLFGETATALARDEIAVGQCGLRFIDAGNSCEWTYGGEGPDPPNGDKLEECWDKASSEYNSCMDKALAAAPPRSGGAIDTSKRKLLNPTLPGSTIGPAVKP